MQCVGAVPSRPACRKDTVTELCANHQTTWHAHRIGVSGE
jgi:hypothetical protein